LACTRVPQKRASGTPAEQKLAALGDSPLMAQLLSIQEDFVTSMVCQIVFGSLRPSLSRGFPATASSAQTRARPNLWVSPTAMISALASLGRVEPGELPKSIQAAGINGKPSLMSLFSTHPPIAALQQHLSER